VNDLEEALGHRFTDPGLLEQALTHRSRTSEHPIGTHNERLEFLGDAVLGLVVAHHLYGAHPNLPEGQLSKVRAAVVGRDALAEIAAGVGLGAMLRLGRGERLTGGHAKESILADAMEAVIGAVYLDGGIEDATRVVLGLWSDVVAEMVTDPGSRDYKSRVQEVLAARGLVVGYLVEGSGPPHDPEFTARLVVDGTVLGEGFGATKKQAQQRAAREALRRVTH